MGIINKVLAKFNRSYVKQIPLGKDWSLYVPTNHYDNINAYTSLAKEDLLVFYIEYYDGEETSSITVKILEEQLSVDALFEEFDELQINYEEKSLTFLE